MTHELAMESHPLAQNEVHVIPAAPGTRQAHPDNDFHVPRSCMELEGAMRASLMLVCPLPCFLKAAELTGREAEPQAALWSCKLMQRAHGAMVLRRDKEVSRAGREGDEEGEPTPTRLRPGLTWPRTPSPNDPVPALCCWPPA